MKYKPPTDSQNHNVESDQRENDTKLQEPVLSCDIVFQSDMLTITKTAEWRDCKLSYSINDENDNRIRVRLANGQLIITNESGKAATSYVNTDKFINGYAIEQVDGRHVIVDCFGNKTVFEAENSAKLYSEIGSCYDGLFCVNANKPGNKRGVYFLDDLGEPGIWGYADTNGVEVIPAQYVFADAFVNDRALVCKGKWEYRENWHEESGNKGWWSEEMLWGFIDKQGNEIVPCIFDNIKTFFDPRYEYPRIDYYRAHFGGLENGSWGIVDRDGNWVIKPEFREIDHALSNDGLFAFFGRDDYGFETPLGRLQYSREACINRAAVHRYRFRIGWQSNHRAV